MMKICEVLALLLFAALTPEVVSANQQERNGSAVADFQNVADMKAGDVYTTEGERIGELSEIVLDGAHRPIAALIETDEGTGTGGKEHVVGAEKLWLKGTRLITNLTRQQVEVRWTRKFGQEIKLGLLLRRTDLNDGQTEAVFGGFQGEGCS